MKKYLLAAMILCICAMLISSVSATLTPATLGATLNPGQSISEGKSVFLPGTIPKGDVIFAFDLTGSMGDAIVVAKSQAISIMNTLSTLITDAQFGVMSFMDYPHSYSSYGYSTDYGYAPDYAYHLDHAITSDKTAVSTSINALTIGSGADGPQDYARIIYESYSDTTIGWRTGAKHIVIILGDSVPHDDNLNQGVPGMVGTYSTGGDPGRDEVMFTADDINLQTALSSMATNEITLMYVKCHTGAFPDDADNMIYWTYWTGITGGAAYGISDASLVPTAIAALVQTSATHIHKLTLKVQEAGYASWLTSVVPSEYDEFDIPSEGVTKTFTITITVPLGTVTGTYVFHITADGDGASYGEQTVTIFVPPTSVVPEVPIGTIMASASMAVGLFAYIGVPRFRRARKPAKL